MNTWSDPGKVSGDVFFLSTAAPRCDAGKGLLPFADTSRGDGDAC